MPSWLRRNLFVLLALDAALFAASLVFSFLNQAIRVPEFPVKYEMYIDYKIPV